MEIKALLKSIKEKNFAPIYVLHGEEAYYIDEITDALEQNVLEEHERDFNKVVFYGKDDILINLLDNLKMYPMMAERRLIILKEAQDFKFFEELEDYFENPVATSVFVVAHKYKALDARKKISKLAAKHVVFKSEKIREDKLPDWIIDLLKKKGFTFNSKVPMMLAMSIGNDLIRIENEINKLSINLQSNTEITESIVEQNIGISKEYNVFELTKAIGAKDLLKALQIVDYFEKNPKAANLAAVIPLIFKLFSQIMRIHFLPDQSRGAIAASIKVSPFFVDEYMRAKKNYNPKKIAENIEILYQYDLNSKGVGSTTDSKEQLMREMVIQLLL